MCVCVFVFTFLPSVEPTAAQVPVSEQYTPEVAGPREERIPSPIEAVRPSFVERLQGSRLLEDANTVLECYVSGQPFPDVYWTKDGQLVKPDYRYALL